MNVKILNPFKTKTLAKRLVFGSLMDAFLEKNGYQKVCGTQITELFDSRSLEEFDDFIRSKLFDVIENEGDDSYLDDEGRKNYRFIKYYLSSFAKLTVSGNEKSFDGVIGEGNERYVLIRKNGKFVNILPFEDVVESESGEPPFFLVKVSDITFV